MDERTARMTRATATELVAWKLCPSPFNSNPMPASPLQLDAQMDNFLAGGDGDVEAAPAAKKGKKGKEERAAADPDALDAEMDS